MIEYRQVSVKRILNPTSINLGDYVINPYMGCEYACLYCYVRSNKAVIRKSKPWGSYIEVRLNALQLLEKEILVKKPKQVLLGSTCECFQPAEEKHMLTRGILEILNRNGIYYTILTRSPYIRQYMQVLKGGYCKAVYFTVNNMPQEFKNNLEVMSPAMGERFEAINLLLENGINVVPYFSPIFPWVSDINGIFLKFPKAKTIEFETLNFRLGNIANIIEAVALCNEELKYSYTRLMEDSEFYNAFWQVLKEEIIKEATSCQKGYNIHIHKFGSYFENKY